MKPIDGAGSDAWFEQEFAGTRVMMILRGLGPARSLDMAVSAWAAGIRAVELPIQTPADIESLQVVAAAAAKRDLRVGAGTVVDVDQVRVAAAAGARYTVSPGSDELVIRASLAAGMPTLPGIGTVSEVQQCRRLGLSWLKLFPAAQLTPAWIAAVRAPFPDVQIVATGGIRQLNAQAFLDAGARVVAFGSALEDAAEMRAAVELG